MFFYNHIDQWCVSAYENLIVPVMALTDAGLKLIFLPIRPLSPHIQIFIVALAGVLLSRTLAGCFKNKREPALKQAFKDRLSSLKHTRTIDNSELKAVIKNGIQTDADDIYNQILLDKFIENGISYFFPLLFLLIWLQYSLFSPEALESLTGQPYAWITDSGIKLSTALLYLYAFNGFLVILFLSRALTYVVKNRRSIMSRMLRKKFRRPLKNYRSDSPCNP